MTTSTDPDIFESIRKLRSKVPARDGILFRYRTGWFGKIILQVSYPLGGKPHMTIGEAIQGFHDWEDAKASDITRGMQLPMAKDAASNITQGMRPSMAKDT